MLSSSHQSVGEIVVIGLGNYSIGHGQHPPGPNLLNCNCQSLALCMVWEVEEGMGMALFLSAST